MSTNHYPGFAIYNGRYRGGDMMVTYQDAEARLKGRESRKLANNTYLQRRAPGCIALKLHKTDILTWQMDAGLTYNTGGWQTVTTKERMNRFGPLRIFSDRGQWYFAFNGTRYCYTEGMRLKGENLYGVDEDLPTKNKLLRKAVKKYAADFMDALEAGNVPAPSGGDCWYCYMRTSDGNTLGENTPTLHPDGVVRQGHNIDHLLSHMGLKQYDEDAEVYYVPSLLARALEVMGASQTMWWWVGRYWTPQKESEERVKAYYDKGGSGYERPRVEKALRRYLGRQLGLAV